MIRELTKECREEDRTLTNIVFNIGKERFGKPEGQASRTDPQINVSEGSENVVKN